MNAIITVSKNLPPWWEELSKPRMLDYASRIGAIFEEVVPDEWRGMASRQLTAEYVAKYDRSLVLDADVVISREAPNIFDLFPTGAAYAASDSEPHDPDAMRQWPLICDIQAVCGSLRWAKGYANTGVVLCDRDDAPDWQDWVDLPSFLCPDQCNLNWRSHLANRGGYRTLPREWNAFGLNTPWMHGDASTLVPPNDMHVYGFNRLDRVHQICHGAFIAHLAGFPEPERSEAMRMADAILP